jgi:hypothetical protein
MDAWTVAGAKTRNTETCIVYSSRTAGILEEVERDDGNGKSNGDGVVFRDAPAELVGKQCGAVNRPSNDALAGRGPNATANARQRDALTRIAPQAYAFTVESLFLPSFVRWHGIPQRRLALHPAAASKHASVIVVVVANSTLRKQCTTVYLVYDIVDICSQTSCAADVSACLHEHVIMGLELSVLATLDCRVC